jgi:hypothetical protein
VGGPLDSPTLPDSLTAYKNADAFSKKIQNHAAMMAVYAVHYNFSRIHKTLRVTPAMQAGLSDHVWNLEEIVMMADAAMPKPERRGPYKKK